MHRWDRCLGLQYLLSVVFIVQMYLAMVVIGLLFLPWALVSRAGRLCRLPYLLPLGACGPPACWSA
jgi:hypothetical protein